MRRGVADLGLIIGGALLLGIALVVWGRTDSVIAASLVATVGCIVGLWGLIINHRRHQGRW